ncbi:Aste57867_14883 [Aphanomyces stellatus]|uniref:Aste57867_14883 protein n=1 Tax=Aphanomyces stellatus TaxID=120398 RepID=A0A485L2N9_9STRA|nr:hypothetical protein As57867_014827 [Aphanomyces stellatus]VFT91700.1 Aste57867_14883 [Aphanomyces stellatus]
MDIDAILNNMAAKTGNVSTVKDVGVTKSSAPKKRKAAASSDDASIWNEGVQLDSRRVLSSEHKVRPCNLQNVYPAYELHRQKCVLKLKSKLNATVEQMGLPKLPNTAYETWQFNSKLAAPEGDPLIPHSGSDYAGLRDELVAVGANRHAANKTGRAMTQEAHRMGQSLLRLVQGGGKKHAVIKPNEDHFLVSYGGHSMRINKGHLDKLQTLYDRHHEEAGAKASQFPDFLFCILLRYESLDGGGFQAALNEECFDVLLTHFDAKMECFASPFNCRYGRFCSAFLDTDMVFGSYGSFFDFRPASGCFEANPPFVPSLIAKMAEHMTDCLTKAAKPLAFIIIIPAWEHTEGWQQLRNSSFNKHYLLISQKHHGYCEGKQQMRPTRYRIASFDTSVFFWQNAMAAKKWPVTEAALEELRVAFKSKQADEREDLGLKDGGKRVKKVKK